jgi:hypothetical protein
MYQMYHYLKVDTYVSNVSLFFRLYRWYIVDCIVILANVFMYQMYQMVILFLLVAGNILRTGSDTLLYIYI